MSLDECKIVVDEFYVMMVGYDVMIYVKVYKKLLIDMVKVIVLNLEIKCF